MAGMDPLEDIIKSAVADAIGRLYRYEPRSDSYVIRDAWAVVPSEQFRRELAVTPSQKVT